MCMTSSKQMRGSLKRAGMEDPIVRWVFHPVPDDLGEMRSVLVGVELVRTGHGHAHGRQRM